MGIAIFNNLQSSPSYSHSHSHHHYSSSFLLSSTSSMSQDYHNQDTGGEAAAAGGGSGGGGLEIFSFPSSDNNGFHPTPHHHHHHQQHMSHQIRRDNKLRDQAEYHSTNPSSLVGIHDVQEEDSASLNHHHHHQVNETTGMLSEMFNFAPGGPVPTAVDLLEHQTSLPRQPIDSGDWYGGRQGMVIDGLGEADSKSHHNNQNRDSSNYSQGQHHHTISGSINADAAAAMQLFLSNPPPRSPSPSPHHHSSSTLHMLLPDPHQQTSVLHHAYAGGGGGGGGGISPSQFSWIPGPPTAASEIGGVVEGQGLSLSLSSSLQHLEAAKAEELRIGDGGVFYYNQPGQAVAAAAQSSSSAAQYYRQQQQQQQVLHQQQQNHHHQVHVSGLGSGLGVMNVLRHSKYVKAAQELLEEFCSVGRGQLKKNKSLARLNSSNSNNGGGGGGSSEKDQLPLPPLSSSDRMEHQRRKVKLVSMLDEVDRRYNHYCEQMQMVVNSFDLVMGFGAAVPYTALAQKAMSRHFRCLKDGIAGQLKQSCEMLGEKESGGAGGSSAGITRGETPRLKALEQSLRQQRAFHQMGMMEQEAWRPQRGLPERSVNILRAWLFEHFLHPYPSDADKHLLARQTGLSRNQVSNWFINARVRLWKPMIEDMYQQEAKEAADDDEDDTSQEREHDQLHTKSQTPPPPPTTILNSNADMSSSAVGRTTQAAEAAGIISGIGEENDPCSSSLIQINTHCFSENQASTTTTATTTTTNINTGGATMLSSAADVPFHDFADDTTCHRRSGASGIIAPDFGGTSVGNHHHHHHLHHVSVHDQSLIWPNTTTTTNTTAAPPLQIRYGTTAAAAGGDVSLTLGLRHAGNMPENASSAFSIRDFGDC